MKAKLKRIMPVCLVVIFFIVALVAQHLPVSNASGDEAPNLTVTNNGDGTFKIIGMTSLMEYNTISDTYEGTWSEGVDAEINLTSEANLFIRYKGGSLVQILPVRNNYAITFSWVGGTSKNISVISESDTYIDWGDGVAEHINSSPTKQTLSHSYSTTDSYTVKIADNAITYFNCNDSGVTALDTTYNGKLTELHCSNNSISTLNLSKNTALESLYCNNNLLSSLDLTNNVLLSKVSCVQETGFDSGVSVINSQFSDTEIYSTTEATESITESKALYKHNYTVVNRVPITIPSAPTVTAIKNDDGTYRLEGVDSTMEYNTKDPNATIWTSYSDENNLQSIKFNETYYIRVKAVENVNTVSLAQTVDVKVVKLEKTINADGSETARVDGMRTDMEYNDVSANYEGAWTPWEEPALQSITENITYHIRLIGGNHVVSLTVNVVERADAPSVTYEYNEDGSCKLVGIDTTMEYNTESPTSKNWTRYVENTLQNISETMVFYIRIAKNGETPSSKILQLTVNPRIMANVSIAQNPDGSYRIDGMTTEMEYNTISPIYEGQWTGWQEGDLQNITESVSYYIRVKEQTSVSVLNIYVITLQENEDRSINILGVTEKMEYNTVSRDYSEEWTAYTTDSLNNISENITYYIRVKSIDGAPVGQVIEVSVVIRPAAPDVQVVNNGDGTYSISPMTTDMEYNTESANYTGTWTRYVEGALDNRTESVTYYIRIAATETTPAGRVKALPVNVVTRPLAPSISYENNADGSIKLIGLDTTMEYNTESADYTGTWTRYVEGALNNITTSGTYYIRVAEDGDTPSGDVCSVVVTTAQPTTYTISYDVNGGNETIEAQIKTHGVDLTLSSTIPTKENCTFLGWSTERTATEATYSAGGTFPLNNNTTLYAVWEVNSTVPETYAIKFVWIPTEEETLGVSQLKKGITITATAETEIDWGDGTVTPVTVENEFYTHDYVTAGEYTVRIKDDVVTSLNLSRIENNGELSSNYGQRKNNQIILLDVSKNTALKYLNCSSNNISELDVSRNTALERLDCYINNISELDVSKNTALIELYCYNNNMSELNVSQNIALERLDCYNNNISELDVSKNTALIELYCYNNNISELDVSQNIALEGLDCSWNNISELDVSKNIALEGLDCSINNISELDVSKNVLLRSLTCGSNNITELDLTQNGVISSVCCVQESLGKLYLTETQENNMTIKDETSVCSYISSANTIHKHPNTTIPLDTVTKPVITVEDNGDGTTKLVGMTPAMEYNTISANYTGRWTKYVSGKLQNITETTTYYVRISATATEPASAVATVYVTPNAFTVTVTSSKNGKVTPDGTVIIPKGGSQEFKIFANSGYKIADVVVDDESVGAVSSYKLTNVTKNHTIKVTFKKIADSSIGGGSTGEGISLPQGIITSSWKNKFTDVSKDDWYYEVVKFVNERKYFSGTSETTFSPDTPMTREMFMVALYNMDGNPITYGPNKYFDVEPGHWSEAAIVWGSAKGIIAGFPDGSFRPSEPVTREQVATIMKKYAEYKYKYTLDRKELTSFNDHEEIYDWAYESISWAVAKGIIKGDNHNYILPHKSATRAEVAAMFMNYKRME